MIALQNDLFLMTLPIDKIGCGCDTGAEIFVLIDLWLLLLQINKDGCGKTKSCYFEPESCTSSGDCQYLVTMKPVGDEDSDDGEVEFELSTTGEWAAIGFNSEKNKMVRKCIRFDIYW